jgi:hypothetical protein
MSHTVADAMARRELTEEEAYFVLRFAGHYGYKNTMDRFHSPLKRLRKWFVWVGGWEEPELSQWDRGEPAWKLSRDPMPFSLFGHRVTFYGWGWSAKVGKGWLVWSRSSGLYWSPNGTPSHPDVIRIARSS